MKQPYQWIDDLSTYELHIGVFRVRIRPYTQHGHNICIDVPSAKINGVLFNYFYHEGKTEHEIKAYALDYVQGMLDIASYDLAEWKKSLDETIKSPDMGMS